MISFIMPVYNGVHYISDAVESIMDTVKTPWEIVICDDKSNDGSQRIISEWAKKDRRIHQIRNSNNIGAGATRNKCIKEAKYDILFALDCDNILCEGVVDRMYLMMLEGKQVVAIQKIGFFGFKNTNDHRPENYWDFTKFGGMVNLEDMLIDFQVPPCSGNYMYRRLVFDIVGGYHDEDVQETWGFGFRHIAAGFPVWILPNSMYLHRFCREGYYLRLPKEKMYQAFYRNVGTVRDRLSEESKKEYDSWGSSKNGSKMILEGKLRLK